MRIIIIGAGPVGMYTVIYFQQKHPTLFHKIEFVLFEKRPAYTRNQIITIQQQSLPEPINRGVDKIATNCNIQIKYFEMILKRYLDSLKNVQFIYGEVYNFYNDSVFYISGGVDYTMSYDILIGCDGSRSKVRELVLQSELYYLYDRPLYTLLIFLQDVNVTEDLNIRNGIYLTTSYGFSSIAVNISEEDYYSDFDPYTLIDEYCDIIIPEDSIIEILKIPVEPFYADVLCRDNVFILGDAALSTHYFSGEGIENGFRTARVFVDYFLNDPCAALQKFMNNYIQRVKSKINESIKDNKIRMIKANQFNRTNKCFQPIEYTRH